MQRIKWDKGFSRKPEVCQLARLLGIQRVDATVLWMEFFEWADSHTADGSIPGLRADDLDVILHHEGFGQAAVATGWVIEERSALRIKNFDRHNGRSAKARLLNAERQQRWRDKGNGSFDV